jgi:hypothetical protein
MNTKQTKIDKPIYEYTAREWIAIWSTARRAEMRRLRETGWTLARIGRKFGISRQAVAQVLK